MLVPATAKRRPDTGGSYVLPSGTVLTCLPLGNCTQVGVLTGLCGGCCFGVPNATVVLRMRPATPLEALLAGNEP